MAVALATACGASARPMPADACAAREVADADLVARVPFDLVDGRIYVQAKANGQGPFRFAVDTGASGMARADARLVSALGLRMHGSAENSDGVSTAEADVTRFDSLQLGGLERREVEALARDYRSRATPEGAFDGILGREFFADGLLVIDYPARTLSFSRARALAPDMAHVVAYKRAFRIPVAVGALQAEGNLDTGANVALVLPKALHDRLGADASDPLEAAGRGRLSNGDVDTWRTRLHVSVRIGALALRDVDARVSARYPELLVGAHALQQSVLVIDQRTKLLAVCTP